MTAGSEGKSLPAGKRAVAIYFAFDRAFGLNIDLVFDLILNRYRGLDLNLVFDLNLDRALTIASTIKISGGGSSSGTSTSVNAYSSVITSVIAASARTSVITSVNVHSSARARTSVIASAIDIIIARAIEDLKIFKDVILSRLIDSLETLKTEIPGDGQPDEVWHAFVNRIEQAYLDALQLKREWLELSEEESNALNNYLYACNLMVRCKESAVRVSRDTWEGIESRMLMPSESALE